MIEFDFGLGETADMIRETTAKFAQDQIAPLAAELDKTDECPRDIWEAMGELGLLGITAKKRTVVSDLVIWNMS